MHYLRKKLLVTCIFVFSVLMCTFLSAEAAVSWTKVSDNSYNTDSRYEKIISYKNYLYTFGEVDALRIEIARINADGTLTDVTPSKKACPEIYFSTGVLSSDALTNAIIKDDKLFVLLNRENSGGCYIKEFSLLNNPAFPEFICNYVPVLEEVTSTEDAFNMAYVNGGIEYIDLGGNKYRFTKNGNYDSASKTYEASSAGTFKKNPYYTYSFTHDGDAHTFYINKNKAYYMDHAHETIGCTDWSEAIYSNVKSISYNEGYVYTISSDNILSVYSFNFSSTSPNRLPLTERLSGDADATVYLDEFEHLAGGNEKPPVFEKGLMYIAGADAVAVLDIRNPENLDISALIPCEAIHDSRTIAVYNNLLFTKVYSDKEKPIEVFTVSVKLDVNAVYIDNSVKISISGIADGDSFMAVLAVYGDVNGVDKLDDFDCKEITKDGEYILTADYGERVTTFLWRKDLTPVFKYIK